MNLLDEFLKSLYTYLIGVEDINNNIIRKHTRKLEQLGDISFPTEISNWQNLINQNTNEGYVLILNDNISSLQEKLEQISAKWCLKICKCQHKLNNLLIFLERKSAFLSVIMQVLNEQQTFGSSDLGMNQPICFQQNNTEKTIKNLNLSELRISITNVVIKNILLFTNWNVVETEGSNNIKIAFNSKSDNGNISILCGPVLNDERTKNSITTAEQLYSKRTVDMRLMAEHKYGLRITSKQGWQEFFEKLGKAAVTIELLQNKPSHAVTISLIDNTFSNSKGASFVLYNCARLATLFKEFDKRVASGIYPNLCEIHEADFSLLTQPEEWELLFVHVMHFPTTIRNTVNDILKGRVNPHYIISMLFALCSTFSIYYRRVKILTEGKSNLCPVMFARIYLLKGVEQVLHNGLYLLDIEPVKQM